ncbi:hypothetical protein B0H13DRAFT_2524246 [Mycena leptocephala]|nr:hypothetical protein B0H13DRAFT_2524246 [Mycena leptocephala]
MPETSSGSSHSILPLRVLHREWKAFKPRSNCFQEIARGILAADAVSSTSTTFRCASGVALIRNLRPQTHKRSHSQPNALRIGHPTRPYYSVIRKDISSYGRLDARQSVASCPPYPVSLLPPASFQTYPISTSDDEEAATAFAFVTSAAQPYEAQTPKRTLSARLSRGLSSPVSALHAMNRERKCEGNFLRSCGRPPRGTRTTPAVWSPRA